MKVLDDPERVVVGLTHAKAEPVDADAAAATPGVAEPEVIKKGKPEDEK